MATAIAKKPNNCISIIKPPFPGFAIARPGENGEFLAEKKPAAPRSAGFCFLSRD
jgi:hypothetical protein